MPILEDFGVQPILLIAQIVNFVILLLILKKFLYGPILKILEKRRNQIVESERKSKQVDELLEKTEREYQKSLQKSLNEADRIINDAKTQAESEALRIVNQANIQVSDMINAAKLEIETERKAMLTTAKKELANIVILATNKLTAKTLNLKDQQKLIEDSIKEIEHEQKIF